MLNTKQGTKEFPVPNGCSILFEFNNKHYCISNAHVLADSNFGKTYFLEGNGISSNMGGAIFTSNPETGETRNKDIFDLAVVLLSQQTVESLKKSGKQFINITDIKTGHRQIEGDRLLFVGYPASKTKIKVLEKKTIERRPFFFVTHPVILKNKNSSLKNDFHVIAKYSKNSTRHYLTHAQSRGPSPRGMSGCGIWLISERYPLVNAQLVGILSEYHDNRSILVGSKIDLYIDLIKQVADPSIPNNGVKIKLT